jgi:hypothetical protein
LINSRQKQASAPTKRQHRLNKQRPNRELHRRAKSGNVLLKVAPQAQALLQWVSYLVQWLQPWAGEPDSEY